MHDIPVYTHITSYSNSVLSPNYWNTEILWVSVFISNNSHATPAENTTTPTATASGSSGSGRGRGRGGSSGSGSISSKVLVRLFEEC
jgi:hypothetical protein